jgi:3-dehydroquinate synthase
LGQKAMTIDVRESVSLNTSGDMEQGFSVGFSFPLHFTRQAFAPENPIMARVFRPDPDGLLRRVLVFMDEGVARAWPELIERIPARLAPIPGITMMGEVAVVPGGEPAKEGLAVVERVAQAAARHGLDRQSYIMAIGGGAMLDAVGLGATLVHRGVRFVRLPSTVLAQNDAGIGVKNGVNAYGQKNFLGAFAPPHAVVNDLDLLNTLPDRHWRCGIAEAVKVACIKSADFFASLETSAAALAGRDVQAMEQIGRASCRERVS